MVPQTDHPQWRKILNGGIAHDFKSVPAGLMVSRLKRQLANDGSETSWETCIREMRAFFTKYEKVMQDDIQAIFS
jgi:hypothetical protein